MARRYDLATREAQRALALEPSLAVSRMLEALTSPLTGRPGCCADLTQDLHPALRTLCQYSQGQVAQAASVIDSLRRTLASGDRPATVSRHWILLRDIGLYYAWIAQGEEAVGWLERAFELSHNAVDFRILGAGILDQLREDRRFQLGMQRIRERMRERLQQERLRAQVR